MGIPLTLVIRGHGTVNYPNFSRVKEHDHEGCTKLRFLCLRGDGTEYPVADLSADHIEWYLTEAADPQSS